MTLNEVPVGRICTVTRINGEGRLRRRIMDMGITKNVEIKVVTSLARRTATRKVKANTPSC